MPTFSRENAVIVSVETQDSVAVCAEGALTIPSLLNSAAENDRLLKEMLSSVRGNAVLICAISGARNRIAALASAS
jgi:hypothetical protein